MKYKLHYPKLSYCALSLAWIAFFVILVAFGMMMRGWHPVYWISTMTISSFLIVIKSLLLVVVAGLLDADLSKAEIQLEAYETHNRYLDYDIEDIQKSRDEETASYKSTIASLEEEITMLRSERDYLRSEVDRLLGD